MSRLPAKFLSLSLALALALLALPTAGAHAAPLAKPAKPPVTTAKVTTAPQQSVAVMVELFETPAALDYAAKLADTSVPKAQALANARAAAKAKVAALGPVHDRLAARLTAAPIKAKELFRLKKAMNAIAVRIAPGQMAAIRALPGVKRVRIIPTLYRSNITSVPFIGAPAAWGNALGLGQSLTGTGIRIGIIDTGIDYQHPMFGGTGALADYQANDRVTIHPGLFPTAKVVGGFDFAGDAYDATNDPTPDPNPMDCNDHGSHVAGTAAGFGVNADGTTFHGPYGPGAPPSSLRIGPGVAPGASLYAIRVFGCGGGTNLVTEGIEFAMDPSGRGDFSDHLDVINMSLGSAFGGLDDLSAQATEAATLVGVAAAVAQGNDGDTFFIGGSPASADHAVSTAAIVDPGGSAGSVLDVTAPATVAGKYAAQAADFGFSQTPNPSGQSGNLVLVHSATGTANQGCDANFTNAAEIAGNIALIQRGTCSFQQKVANAQTNGAIGAVVYNNVPNDPTLIIMGASGATPVITIPSVFISDADGTALAAANDVTAALDAANAGDTLASFSSRGPRGGGTFPIRLKPDVSAPGLNIPSTQSGITCTTASNAGCIVPSDSGFIPGGQVLVISGTSMATPHVAGSMALLRQLHPDWSVEEIKASLMNGAIHDITTGDEGSGLRFGPGRIGAGRVDIPAAATSEVTVFNDDDPGLVTLGFDSAIITSGDQIKNLRVVNHGTQAQTFDLALDDSVLAAGVSFSLVNAAQAHLTVAAGSAVVVPVQMNANAARMDHNHDLTIAPTQTAPAPLDALGNLPRHWLTEAASYLTFSQGGTLKLRVPLYSAPMAASAMTAAAPIATGGVGAGTSAIALSGIGVCTGTNGSSGCAGNFPVTEVSLVTPLELQVTNPLDPFVPGFANIQYAGVAYDKTDNLLLFGISTWGPWSSPNDVAFNIYVDSQNNGTFDKVLFNSSPGMMSSSLFGNPAAVGQDVFLSAVFDANSQQVSTENFINILDPTAVDSRLFGNNVMVLAVSPQDLGLKGSRFNYRIETCPGFAPLCTPLIDFAYESVAGPFTWDYLNPGVDFGGTWLDEDLDGTSLPLAFNFGNVIANQSKGALVLHTHNTNGTQAQAIPFDTGRFADIALTSAVSPATLKPRFGQIVTLTLSANNIGPRAARGVSVFDFLPEGLLYLTDDSGGAYDPSDGIWFIGQMAVGSTATLHITAEIVSGGEIVNTAQIASTALLDPNPSNDISTLTIGAPRLADLAVKATGQAAGQLATFTISLSNNGTDPSYNPRVNVVLGGARYNGATITPSSGTFDTTSGIWQPGSVGVGSTSTLKISVHAPHSTTVGISATAVPTSTPDPNLINNRASASVTTSSH